MNGLFLRLCGVKVEHAADVAGAELTLRHSGALGWMLALAVALGVLTWWTYRRDAHEIVTKGRRRVLIALRILLFSLLLLLLLRPVLAFTVETSIRRTLLTLLDASGSMKIHDPRFDDADLKRVSIAKGDIAARKGSRNWRASRRRGWESWIRPRPRPRSAMRCAIS